MKNEARRFGRVGETIPASNAPVLVEEPPPPGERIRNVPKFPNLAIGRFLVKLPNAAIELAFFRLRLFIAEAVAVRVFRVFMVTLALCFCSWTDRSLMFDSKMAMNKLRMIQFAMMSNSMK